MQGGRRSGLIVVAEGAGEVQSTIDQETSIDSMRASLSPGATGHSGDHVIERSGHVAQSVALQIQRLTDCETYPIVWENSFRGDRLLPSIASWDWDMVRVRCALCRMTNLE